MLTLFTPFFTALFLVLCPLQMSVSPLSFLVQILIFIIVPSCIMCPNLSLSCFLKLVQKMFVITCVFCPLYLAFSLRFSPKTSHVPHIHSHKSSHARTHTSFFLLKIHTHLIHLSDARLFILFLYYFV